MGFCKPIATAAALLLAAGSANAAVLYQFSSPNSAFALTTPTFITAQTPFTAAALDSCTARPGYSCVSVEFFPITLGVLNFGGSDYDGISFQITDGSFGLTTFYYYADGALGIPGTYAGILTNLGTTLTVSGAPDVPEPATWLMLIAGFGLAGAALRRQTSLRTSVTFTA